LSDSGLNHCKILDTLIREDNVDISRPGISLFLKRYIATFVIDDENRENCANVGKKPIDEHLRFIFDILSLIIFIPLFNPLLDPPLKMYRYRDVHELQ
jgi:surface polysaccharide O-acyltransferase-like enzyme